MLILDASYQSIVLRRNRGSLAADFSSLDTKWMDVRAVEPAFDRKPQAVTEHKTRSQTLKRSALMLFKHTRSSELSL